MTVVVTVPIFLLPLTDLPFADFLHFNDLLDCNDLPGFNDLLALGVPLFQRHCLFNHLPTSAISLLSTISNLINITLMFVSSAVFFVVSSYSNDPINGRLSINDVPFNGLLSFKDLIICNDHLHYILHHSGKRSVHPTTQKPPTRPSRAFSLQARQKPYREGWG